MVHLRNIAIKSNKLFIVLCPLDKKHPCPGDRGSDEPAEKQRPHVPLHSSGEGQPRQRAQVPDIVKIPTMDPRRTQATNHEGGPQSPSTYNTITSVPDTSGLPGCAVPDRNMTLALSVAENVMGGRSPSLRRVSVKQAPEEPKGIGSVFKKKKHTEPVMVFSFSSEEVVDAGGCGSSEVSGMNSSVVTSPLEDQLGELNNSSRFA